MNERLQSIRIKARSERRYLLIIYGGPILLALITVTSIFSPFVRPYGERVGMANFIIAILVCGLVGIFQSGIDVPIPKRVTRGVGDGIFGGIFYGISVFAIGMLFNSLGISRWMSFLESG